MQVYCQGGSHDVPEAQALLLDGIREDTSAYVGQEAGLVARFSGSGLVPLLLLTAPQGSTDAYGWVRDHAERVLGALVAGLTPAEVAASHVEVFNEPTGTSGVKTSAGDPVTRDQYVEGITAVAEIALRVGYTGRIWAGGLANLSRSVFDWYRETVPRLPSTVGVGFHGYPWGTQTQHKPWPPYRTWPEAIGALQQIAAGRLVASSENGQHTAEEQEAGIFGRRVRRTDEDIRAWWVERLQMEQACGLAFSVIYQWIDGPTDTFIDRFGLHREDGSRKPQASAVADFKGVSMAAMQWTKVRVVNNTLALVEGPDAGKVLSFGPRGWEPPRPAGTTGPYEHCGMNGGHVTYTPPASAEIPDPLVGVFPFQLTTREAGISLIAMENPE